MIRAWPRLAANLWWLGLLGCGLLRKQNGPDAGTTSELESGAEFVNASADASSLTPLPKPGPPTAEPAHRHVGSHCEGGEVAIVLQPGEDTCVVECRSATACPAGWVCDGEGTLSNGGRPGSRIGFCRIETHAKGPDAGSPASRVDAGNAAPQPSEKDAGSPVRKFDVKLVSGKCPGGYRTCGAGCRLACAKDTDCSRATARCQNGYCLGPGAVPCAK
jgi:hypothetical protein